MFKKMVSDCDINMIKKPSKLPIVTHSLTNAHISLFLFSQLLNGREEFY